MSDYLLYIQGLKVYFHVKEGIARAVDKVSLAMEPGDTLALVGETGCGKSVVGHAVMGLIPEPTGEIPDGRILFAGENLLAVDEARMEEIRGKDISMIFQNPLTALNPAYKVGDQVGEAVRLYNEFDQNETRRRVIELFDQVEIPSPKETITRFPRRLDIGMRQRVLIAMALAGHPRLMIIDEPIARLDILAGADVLRILEKIKKEADLSILLLTRDLDIAARMAHQVAVMYAGKIMEYTDVETLFNEPKHPYTVGLLNSTPTMGRGRKQKLETLSGKPPLFYNLPAGCLFSDRCPNVFSDCRVIEPKMVREKDHHLVRCLKYA